MLTSCVKRCRGQSGVSSIEYALLGCLIAVVCVVIVTATGLNTLALYTWVCNEVQGAIGGPGC
jgi:Flp pilus assembly pilin Flp